VTTEGLEVCPHADHWRQLRWPPSRMMACNGSRPASTCRCVRGGAPEAGCSDTAGTGRTTGWVWVGRRQALHRGARWSRDAQGFWSTYKHVPQWEHVAGLCRSIETRGPRLCRGV